MYFHYWMGHCPLYVTQGNQTLKENGYKNGKTY